MDLFSSSLSFLLSAYGIFNFNRDLQGLFDEYSSINTAKIYTPSSLIESLLNIKDKSQLDYSKTNKNEIILQGFIEGIVQSDNFVKSSLKETIKLVYKMSFLSQIYDNDRFVNPVTLLKQIPKQKNVKQVSFFDLKDYEGKSYCRIYKNLQVIATQALNLINTDKKINNKITFFRKIFSFFYIFFQILSLFAQDKLSYKGVPVGTCDVELGIEIDNFITVYGKIIYNFVTKSLRIEKPDYFLKDKSFILDEILKKIRRKRIILILYCFINFYCGIKLLKKLIVFVRNFLKNNNEKENLKLKNLDKFRQYENLKCVICYQQVRNIIFTPCKHMAVCNFCLKNMRGAKQCPICKDRYHSYIQIFTK